METPRYIVLEGPIGVGKTSLAKILIHKLAAASVLETVQENPFLKEFYQDRKRHAFQTQMYFLLNRFKQQQDLTIAQPGLFQRCTISDYLFSKDKIFASMNLDPAELALYHKVYDALHPQIISPDLVIYLHAAPEVLMQRIKKRNLDFERPIKLDYIKNLTQAYNSFFFEYDKAPLLVIDTSEIDFIESPQDLENLVTVIRQMKKGRQYYRPLGSKAA